MGLIKNLFKKITSLTQDDYKQKLEPWLIDQWVENNDAAAFTELYNRYSVIIFDFLINKKVSLQIAEEGVQHCFIMLVENKTRLKEINNFKNYFLTVAYNYSKKHFKRTGNEVSLDEKLENNEILAVDNTFTTNDFQYSKNTIAKVLTELKEEDADIIRLRIEGYKASEILEILSISDETKIKNSLYRSRKYIKKRLLELPGE